MTFDFDAVKARVGIEALFREDGHELKRSGNRLRCLSPFNKERTPSCYVDVDRGRFKCFSSGNSGDIFDYVMLTRGCDNKDAYAQLAQKAGVLTHDGHRALNPPKPRVNLVEVEKPLEAMGGEELATWLEGVAALKASPAWCAKVAVWRGFSSRSVMDLANHGKIGLVRLVPWLKRQDPVMPDRRVAFPVEGYCDLSSDGHRPPLQLLAYHVRLLPREPQGKAGWRYMPSGCGSWPYVLGDVESAKFLIICEGQWDAMAFFDALDVSYEEMVEGGMAIAAMRGAANWRLFVEHYLLDPVDGRETKKGAPLRPGLRALVICDADMAGESWNVADGDGPSFVEVMQAICGKVYVREPMEGCKDLNDLWKVV